jgi:beta-galactosidase
VSYLGTLPDRAFARGLGRWLAPAGSQALLWSARPASVTVTGARNARGERLHFLSNWSWEPVHIEAPLAVRDLLSGEAVPAGGPIALGPWDVRVFVGAPPRPTPDGDEVGARRS